ncbi:testis-expressed sequence 15 isoform X2 [Pelobates cultripes]|uniref:Testis-expressed sequence 15 isoform X2 n=1 Tax=Pelobates cultripes TaxID=61616 RepID=A0AAD1S5A1_PELCU|nr:testis-expressed sequence 15 isoform X2 [Pelobates cultripes]
MEPFLVTVKVFGADHRYSTPMSEVYDVYVYEYDTNVKAVEKPRHCLPYAILSARFVVDESETEPTIPTVRFRAKFWVHGKEKLMNCTVAKRIGKGKGATIIYENIQVRAPVVEVPAWTKEITTVQCTLEEGLTFAKNNEQQNIVTPNLCHKTGAIDDHSASHQHSTLEEIEATGPFSRETAELESLMVSSMVITSKSIKDPRLSKRMEQDISKAEEPYPVSQLKPDILSNLEDSPKTKSIYLSFEEVRMSDETLKRKEKNVSFSVESCNRERRSKTESLQKKCLKESLNSSSQTFVSNTPKICTRSPQKVARQTEIEKEEQLPISTSRRVVMPDSKEIIQTFASTSLCEGASQKHERECDSQQKCQYATKTETSKSVPGETSQTLTQNDCVDKNNSPRIHYQKKSCLGSSKSTEDLNKHIRTSSLVSRHGQSTDSSKSKINKDMPQHHKRNEPSLFSKQKTIVTENDLAKKVPVDRDGPDSSKINTLVAKTDSCKSDSRLPLINKELSHKVNIVSKCPVKEKCDCSQTDRQNVSSQTANTDKIGGLKNTLKEITVSTKELDCKTSKSSVRMLDKKVPFIKKQITCIQPETNEMLKLPNARNEAKKNETKDRLYLSHQQCIDRTPLVPAESVQRLPKISDIKIQDKTLANDKSKSVTTCCTNNNNVTLEDKGEVCQGAMLTEMQKVEEKSRIVNKSENVDCDVNNKFSSENPLSVPLPKNDKANTTYTTKGLSLQSVESKDSVMVDLSSKGCGTGIFGDKNKVIQNTGSGINKEIKVPSDAYGGMLSDELSYIQQLESRIDWFGLFGKEYPVTGQVTEHSKLPKTSLQPYVYKAKKEKEPGGMRIFPDMKITVRNTVYGTLTSSVELQSSLKKMSNDIDNYREEPSEQVSQTTRNLVTQDLKEYSTKLNGGSDELNIAQSCNNSATAERTSPSERKDVKSLEKEFTTSTSIKIKSKEAHIILEHKQRHSVLKMKKFGSKRLPRLVIKGSVGRIKKFSQSEENIKSVLNMLSDEATSCKSKRISKKLDRAILHLRKAHKRVHKSLQLVQRRNLTKPPIIIAASNTNPCKNKDIAVNDVPESHIKAMQVDLEVQKIANQASDINSEIKPKKPTLDDRHCLKVTTQTKNGISNQIPQQSKTSTLTSSTSSTPIMKCLASSYNANKSSPELPEDSTHIFDCRQSNKENTVAHSVSEGTNENTQSKICVQNDETLLIPNNTTDLLQNDHLPVSKVTTLNSNDVLGKDLLKTEDENIAKMQYTLPKVKYKSSSLIKQMSRLLRDADKTHSLGSLQQYKLTCKKMFPIFVEAFVKDQKCSLSEVIVDRKLLANKNIEVSFKHVLRPCAIESFIEMQMMMETTQFIENRMHYLQREPTFRSLLWYDSSLYTELIAGESGYQQQSHLYRTFQEKLKCGALGTLQSHHDQLCEVLQSIHESNSSYYVFLKYRREIEECEAVLNNCSDHSEFSLSVPLTCGVHIGDTIDNLEKLQKSTLELIKNFAVLQKCDPGKQEHALCLLEIISAKIDFIKSSEFIPMQLSIFGIEHLLFDAAKTCVLSQQSSYAGLKKSPSVTKEFMFTVNHCALSKLYEIYGTPTDEVLMVQERDELGEENTLDKDTVFHPPHTVHYVGKIIDQARCAEPQVLKEMIQDCKEHLDTLIKYFQILQECDANQIIITRRNLLKVAERHDKLTILLKPEAVETYIEVGMTFETLHFLISLVSSQKKQKRHRGLLYYDSSLFSDLLNSQHRIISYLQGDIKCKALDVIDRTISEIKSELEIICDFSDSVNYTYALQIMTRELSELSELKNFVLETESEISTYVHFSPFVASIHYGNTSSELDYNYNQFSDLLGLLMSAPKKDLGKMAHTMKVMKTIEIMKDAFLKPDNTAFDLIICQMETGTFSKDVEIHEKEKTKINKMDFSLSPRKREMSLSALSKNNQELNLSLKKQKVLESSTSSSETEEEKAPTISPRKEEYGVESQKITNNQNNSPDSKESDNMDLDNSIQEGQEMEEDAFYPQQIQQGSCDDWRSQALVPMSGSHNQLSTNSYPWYYSLYFWCQNGGNASVMTQSYQRSYSMQQNIPYGAPPSFSMQNSYAASQSYSNFANQIQSSMIPTSVPFSGGMTYAYNALPSQFSYNPSTRGAWSWGH